MSATLDMDAIIAAATAAAIAAVQGDTASKPTRKSPAKKSPAKVEEAPVPTLLRWRGNVAAKPGADFRHTVKRTGESATYHRCSLAEAIENLESAYASGAFYAYRVK